MVGFLDLTLDHLGGDLHGHAADLVLCLVHGLLALLRNVGFGLNDTVTTPLVDAFYEWLLLDPDVPDDEKGDYQVDTSGALAISRLIRKNVQNCCRLARPLKLKVSFQPLKYACP